MKFIILATRVAEYCFGLRVLKSNLVLIMNLTSLILILTCLQVTAEGFSQQITLTEKNASLKDVLQEIKKQSGYQILYNSDLIEKAKPVTINLKKATLKEALTVSLAGQPFGYELHDRTILISPKPLTNKKPEEEQRKPPVRVTGKVTDSRGDPLAGVSVQAKGTNIGIATDGQGNFSLTTPDNAILVFSLVGFVSQEVQLNGRTTLNIQLKEDLQALSEVVVTGYSTEVKKDIVGSVSVVNTNELLSTPSGNVSSQLQGRAAGVTVSTNGELGGSAKVRIRGFGSFTGSDPLYIIDGVPSSSGIDNLNPDDIESLQVLKDASSASIYGARAANGVIIITTKKGKNGPVKINVSSYAAVNSVSESDFPKLLDVHEYGEMYWKQMEGAGYKVGDPGWNHPQYGNGATPVIPEYILVRDNNANIGGAELERIRVNDPARFQRLVDPAKYDFATHQIVKSANTNWFKEFYNPALQQNYNVSATGGSDNGSYMLSLNHFNQKSTSVETNFFKRYSLTANASYNLGKKIRVGENLRLSYINSNRSNPYPEAAWTMVSLIPVYDIMGNPASTAAPGTTGSEGYNPITEGYHNRFDKNDSYGIFGNVYGEVDLVKGLTARTSFGFDRFSRTIRDFSALTYEHGENFNNNSLLASENNSSSWTWTNTLNFSRTFADSHDFKLLVGMEAIKNFNEFVSATRLDFPVDQQDNPDFHVINAGLGSQTNSGYFGRNSLYSLFSRVDYSYQGKYLLNGTLRRDASSKFAKNNRVGYFPAAAVGWRISAEPFMKKMQWVNDLKLRASWGIIGNQTGLSSDNQFDVYISDINQSYPIGGSNSSKSDSYILSRIGDPNARWEKNITTNIGLDATLFNSSVNLTVDVYNKKISGLLVQNQAALTGGSYTQPYINAGEMENNGFDIGLSKRGRVNDFSYDVGILFSTYKNKVTKVLDNPLAALLGAEEREGFVTRTAVGQPVSMFYGYQIEGFFNTQADVDAYTAANSSWLPPAVGRWKIQDVNGDNVVNALDRTIIGNPHPDFQTSFNFSFGYKKFDLNAMFFWNQGGDIYNQQRYVTDFNSFSQNRSARLLYESWTPELGDKAKLPKLDLLDSYSNQEVTSYYVEDASYLRFRTLQLGYTLPEKLLSRIKVDRVRVYVQGQNLFTVSKFSGLDPDASLSGGDLAMGVVTTLAPTPRQILFGLNVGF